MLMQQEKKTDRLLFFYQWIPASFIGIHHPGNALSRKLLQIRIVFAKPSLYLLYVPKIPFFETSLSIQGRPDFDGRFQSV